MLQLLIYEESHVSGTSNTLFHILCISTVYLQSHLVTALPVLSLCKFLFSTFTVSYSYPHSLHSGVSEVLPILHLIEFVLKLVLEQDQAFYLLQKPTHVSTPTAQTLLPLIIFSTISLDVTLPFTVVI